LLDRRALLIGVLREGVGTRQPRHEEVRVDADQALRPLAAHRVGDGRAHIAALGHVAAVAEARARPPRRVYPGRGISSPPASAKRPGYQPSSLGTAEKP